MTIYVDKLDIRILRFINLRQNQDIVVFESLTFFSNFLSILLLLCRINVREYKFFLGDCDRASQSSHYEQALRLSFEVATELAQELCSKGFLNGLNRTFGRNTLKLSLTKYYQVELFEFMKRLVLMRSLTPKGNDIYIKKPKILSKAYIDNTSKFEKIRFYSQDSWIGARLSFVRRFLYLYFRRIYLIIISLLNPLDIKNLSKKNKIILSNIEDTFSDKREYRAHQFWLKSNTENVSYFVLGQATRFNLFEKSIQLGNTTLLANRSLGIALKNHQNSRDFEVINKHKKDIYVRIFNSKLSRKIYAFSHIYHVLEKCIEIASLAKLVNAKMFVFKECHGIYTDAIQLVSENINIKTIAIQYSNITIRNALMLSTADKYLIFSEIYKEILSNDTYTPKEFVVTGYLYRQAINSIKNNAINMRSSIQKKGVNLIIGYFDESVETNKWGLVSSQHHLHDLELLAKNTIKYPDLAVIFKSQFVRNSPINLYPNSSILKTAFATGRFIVLSRGNLRNDVDPAEVALIADICIGHLFGATANLEVAVCGGRNILLNEYNIKPDWLRYIDRNIIFPNK